MTDFNIEDVFGRVPGRPNHPDFWRLSEILLSLDAGNDEDARTMAVAIAEGKYCDPASMTYAAQQRCQRLFAATGLNTLLPPQAIKAFMALWIEGFIAGSEFRKRQDVTTIDAEVDEHARRQPEGDFTDIRFHDGLAHARETINRD